MKRPSLGEQELAIFRFVSENAPIAARRVADAFADSHKLARTTVVTVLERLRTKGYLSRREDEGTFLYEPTEDPSRVTSHLIRNFIQQKLGGSIGSFVAYLAEEDELTAEQIAELRSIVDKLDEGGSK